MPAQSRSRSERWLGVTSFADASRQVRGNILAPSGGWLFDVCTQVSDATGLWDVLVLSAMFVVGWATLRLSPKEISLVLGKVFDVTVPLQHQLSENGRVQEIHKSHLAGYWPVLYCGLAVEVAGYLLVHPDLFTLVVCVKTTLLTVIWLGRADGKFWTSQWYKGRNPPTSTSSAPPATGDKRKEWEEQLRQKGYTSDEGIKQMVDALAKLPEKDQERSLRHMLKASDKEVEDRNKKWALRQAGDSKSRSSSSKKKGRTDPGAPPSDSSGDERPGRSTKRRSPAGRERTGGGGTETLRAVTSTPTVAEVATSAAPALPAAPAPPPSPAAPPGRGSTNLPVHPKSGASRWPRRDQPRNAWRGNMAPN